MICNNNNNSILKNNKIVMDFYPICPSNNLKINNSSNNNRFKIN